MKNNLRTIFDESMGGKPRKQPAVSRPVKTNLRPLFLILFLLELRNLACLRLEFFFFAAVINIPLSYQFLFS